MFVPLRFTQGNAKLDDTITIFSLPAGWSCPFASACLSKANERTGLIKDGPYTDHRCHAASAESRSPQARRMYWHNYRLLKKCRTKEQMTQLLLKSLSDLASIVRIHAAGDFFSQRYFDAWLQVARERDQTLFYGYTKSLRYWLARLQEIPENLCLTASYGGKHDDLIAIYGLRSARVVLSEEEAEKLGLEIDHDDSHAMRPGPDFALLIHGSQPAGTPASRAVQDLRNQGVYGYGREKKRFSPRFSLT